MLFSRECTESAYSEEYGFERVNSTAEATCQAESLLLVCSAGAVCLWGTVEMRTQIRGYLCWFEIEASRKSMWLSFMRGMNIRTSVASCLQKVRLGLRAWADRDQGNLHGLTLAQIPQTALCGLSPSKKMGLNKKRWDWMYAARSHWASQQGGDLPPLLPQHGGEGPRGKIAFGSGQKDLLSGDIVTQGSHQVSWFLILLLCTQSWIALLRFG